MNATPPAEFSIIGLHGTFQKCGPKEWHGECPWCGGRDRFVVFTDRQYPSWNFFCRKCHPEIGWIDEINPRIKEGIPPERLIAIAREREESLRKEIELAQEVLKELQQAQVWLKYHSQLDDRSRALWNKRGIPDVFQDIWGLGYDPDHVFWYGNIEHHTPTLTIPIIEPVTRNVTNVRHRLLNPPRANDKYRPEVRGLPAPMFVSDPDKPLNGRTMIVEGEIKSMVTYIAADDPSLQVVGVPGKNIPAFMYSKFKDCEPIYLCLDPDAGREARLAAAALGKSRCRLIELPDKIDDLILNNNLDSAWMKSVMAQAVRF